MGELGEASLTSDTHTATDGSLIALHVVVRRRLAHARAVLGHPCVTAPTPSPKQTVCLTIGHQEPYRGRGLAKAVTRKLFGDHLGDYGDDGWGSVDVFVENQESQGLCRSLGGRLGWLTSW